MGRLLDLVLSFEKSAPPDGVGVYRVLVAGPDPKTHQWITLIAPGDIDAATSAAIGTFGAGRVLDVLVADYGFIREKNRKIREDIGRNGTG